ncbi:MAG: glucokinase [Acidobacteriales bacterium]|nr:glucokinase [Terriglobales bacterium]
MSQFSIGVDLGGTNLRIAAVEESGHILETITTGTEVSRGRDVVITEMCDAIRALSVKFQASGSLRGIGIGVPGIIDMKTGMVLNSPNLPGWRDFPVRQEIERRLMTHVILENDANSAAFGEKWLGAGRDYDDLCMLTLGTGVGGGLVFEGRIWHGMTGMAGELGHTAVEPNGHPCGCGSVGCLEQYASATAIKRMAKEAVAAGGAGELEKAFNRGSDDFSAKLIYTLAIQGDKPAQNIFKRVGQALGVTLASLINGLNLPIYVIGGGVSHSWDAFAPTMMEEIKKRSFVYVATSSEDPNTPRLQKTIVTRAVLGGDAGLLGAARLPMVMPKR